MTFKHYTFKYNMLDFKYRIIFSNSMGNLTFSFQALSELQKLSGQQLVAKDGKMVTISAISLTPFVKQAPEEASGKVPPSSVSEHHDVRTVW